MKPQRGYGSALKARFASQVKPASLPGYYPCAGLAIAASLAFVLFAAWSLLRILYDHSANAVSTQELVVASYVRSQMLPSHRVDVESSNQHTVKPWFAGKIDFAPAVPDLKDQGFELVGGRLDYLDKQAVATLVYQRRKHLINLFIWPAPTGAEVAPTMATRQGYQLAHWTQSGMNYWAVSDLNGAELQEFARQVQAQAR